MTFRVGQKVVCVDAAPRRGRRWVYDDPPVEGRVYTIEGIIDFEGEPNLILIEQKRDPRSDYEGYRACRFRPVVERKTDISFAHEILRKASKPARAPAVTSPHGAST
jgi:hypothetical protein